MHHGAVTASTSSGTRWLAFVLIASGTTLGLAGTDLILPAVPSLLQIVGVSCFIVAANVTGFLAYRFDAQRLIFGGSLLACDCARGVRGACTSLGCSNFTLASTAQAGWN
jgi:hypothetical protein